MLNSLVDKQKQDDASQDHCGKNDISAPETLESIRVVFEETHKSRPGIYELWPDERLRRHTLLLMEQKRQEAEMASAEDIVQDEREWEELKKALNSNRVRNQEIPLF